MNEDIIQTLLDGYENPTVLSDPEDGNILYSNNAVYKNLGLKENQVAGTRLYDLFSSKNVIRSSMIWRYQNSHYTINEEKIRLSGKPYIKATIKPIEETSFVNLVTYQQEMAEFLVHRFRSPLNGIIGFVDILKDSGLTEKQLQYVEKIDNGLDDFKMILENIDPLASEIEVQKSTISIKELVDQLLSELSPKNRRRINVQIDDGLFELKSDYVLLKDIVFELIRNAIDHSSSADSPIELSFTGDKCIRVTNFGSPIPKEHVRKLYYPFFTTKARNLGLGLTKCIHFVRKLGYELELVTNSNVEGITFEINIIND